MTVIDVHARAERLEISYDAYKRGIRKVYAGLAGVDADASDDEQVAIMLDLPEDELVAVIRWQNYHVIFPNHFDWNGWIKKPA